MRDRDTLIRALRDDGIDDERVLAALQRVPREEFLEPDLRAMAYHNEALPIAAGQTISQPYIVALMSSALGLRGGERVLEIGTGSGYQTAVLALLARHVVSVERRQELASAAQARLQRLGIDNVEIHLAADTLGWPPGAPYDGIVCTASAPRVPASLLEQLAPQPGARLVIPVGSRSHQDLLVVRHGANGPVEESLGPVRFVSLIGPEGWPE